jgi:hypothetical protein
LKSAANSQPPCGSAGAFLHPAPLALLGWPAEVDWIAPKWVARGAITEVDGKIKSAGKTTWITYLCRAALDGLDFMGDPTVKTKVVYLTEQSPSTFREALRRADLLDRDDFVVLFWRDTMGLKWPEVRARQYRRHSGYAQGCSSLTRSENSRAVR